MVALLLTGCGGDDDSTAEPGDDDAPALNTSGDGGDAGGSDAGDAGPGSATVTVDGVTMRFEQVEPGPNDDYYTFCTQVSGTLQAVFPQVDDAGNVLGGELSVILIEPGSAAAGMGEPPEFAVHNGERFWMYDEADPFDIPASGRSANGTATLRESGAMNPETGEIDTTPFEATLDISC